MKISVFGSGYVGLVQAAVLAEVGHDVLCMDIDRNKVERLAQGLASIYEPGLDALLREGLDSGRLRFSSDARLAVEHGRVQFIAVGTPPARTARPISARSSRWPMPSPSIAASPSSWWRNRPSR